MGFHAHAAHLPPQRDPFHPRHQIAPRRLDHQVQVIGHQAECVHFLPRLPAGFVQCGQKPPADLLHPEKNGLLPIITIHHRVDRSRMFNPQLTLPSAGNWRKQDGLSITGTPFRSGSFEADSNQLSQ